MTRSSMWVILTNTKQPLKDVEGSYVCVCLSIYIYIYDDDDDDDDDDDALNLQ